MPDLNDRFDFDNAWICECGPVRGNNEDMFLALPKEGIYVVADGMGGASAGEIASHLICDTLADALADAGRESPGNRKYTFHQTLHKINTAVNEYREAHGYRSMGSTIVAILFNPWDATSADIVNCGDSRCYCCRNGELLKLSIDHTLDRAYKDNPAFAGKSNVLTNHIGAVDYMTASWQRISVCPGDIFILCSDGLTTCVSDEDIQDILSAEGGAEKKVQELQKAVLAGGGKDNYTILCIVIPDELPGPQAVDEEERQESDLLYQIAEKRKDYGK